jgi:hypothetical protein
LSSRCFRSISRLFIINNRFGLLWSLKSLFNLKLIISLLLRHWGYIATTRNSHYWKAFWLSMFLSFPRMLSSTTWHMWILDIISIISRESLSQDAETQMKISNNECLRLRPIWLRSMRASLQHPREKSIKFLRFRI